MKLRKLAHELESPIEACHFPPGTRKWNKIEQRLFSFITQNWRGKPLVSHEVIVNLIRATNLRPSDIKRRKSGVLRVFRPPLK